MLNGTDYCWAEHTRNWYKRFCIRIRFSDVNATKSNPKFEMSSKLLFRIASNHLISCLFWLSLPFSLSLSVCPSLFTFFPNFLRWAFFISVFICKRYALKRWTTLTKQHEKKMREKEAIHSHMWPFVIFHLICLALHVFALFPFWPIFITLVHSVFLSLLITYIRKLFSVHCRRWLVYSRLQFLFCSFARRPVPISSALSILNSAIPKTIATNIQHLLSVRFLLQSNGCELVYKLFAFRISTQFLFLLPNPLCTRYSPPPSPPPPWLQ